MAKPSDVILSRLILARKLATKDQIKECYREKKARQKGGKRVSLMQLLVKKGFVRAEDLLDLRRDLQKYIFLCPECGSKIYIPPGSEESGVNCYRCGARLSISKSPSGPTITTSLDFMPLSDVFPREIQELTSLGHFQVITQVGRGAMGAVFKAKDLTNGKIVALKVLLGGEEAGETQKKRFQREAEAARKLDHPYIVRIHEYGRERGLDYLAMDFIDGKSLDKLLKGGDLDLEAGLALLEKVGRAVDYAHEKGVIHRDLKPANIMVDGEGTPWITDFGLAKDIDELSSLTQTGAILGTPLYMAPEQVLSDLKAIDRTTDIYALGVIMYNMLTGHHPFRGRTLVELYHKILRAEVDFSGLSPPVPRDLRAICAKAMEKEQEHRYLTGGAFADDIARYLAGEKVAARPVGPFRRLWRRLRKRAWVLLLVSLCLLLAISGYFAVIAMKNSEETVKQSPEDRIRSHITLGVASLQRGALDDAEKHLHGAIQGILQARLEKKNPPDHMDNELSAAQYQMGQLCERKNDLDGAVNWHKKAYRTRSKDLSPLLGLARAYRRKGDLKRAMDTINRVLRRKQHPATAYLEKARIFRQKGNLRKVEEYCGKAVERIPRLAEAYYLRADARLGRGNAVGAVEDLARAASIDPVYAAAYRARLAQILSRINLRKEMAGIEKRKPAEGEKVFHRFLTGYYGFLGIASGRLGERDAERAIRDFTVVIGIEPACAGARIYRAYLYHGRERDQQALSDLDAVLKGYPRSAFTHFLRALVQEKMGARDRALSSLENARALGIPRSWIEEEPELAVLRNTAAYRERFGR
jgi:serine/threonine protein kinase/Tfp pilus assembly protein PilF